MGICGVDRHEDPPKSALLHIGDLTTSLPQADPRGGVDVCAIFGGKSVVGQFCARRRLTRGENFDLVTGFDLTTAKHQQDVLKYIGQFGSFAIVLGPPCTGFGHWSHLNRHINPET